MDYRLSYLYRLGIDLMKSDIKALIRSKCSGADFEREKSKIVNKFRLSILDKMPVDELFEHRCNILKTTIEELDIEYTKSCNTLRYIPIDYITSYGDEYCRH